MEIFSEMLPQHVYIVITIAPIQVLPFVLAFPFLAYMTLGHGLAVPPLILIAGAIVASLALGHITTVDRLVIQLPGIAFGIGVGLFVLGIGLALVLIHLRAQMSQESEVETVASKDS